MKKSNLIKVFSILLISVMVMLFTTNVFAAETDDFNDLTNTLNGTNTNNANTNSANTNVSLNTNKTNTANNTNKANTNNSSIYNNTNLPKTGIEDSVPVAMLVVLFAISSVYAYKKIKDYKNI